MRLQTTKKRTTPNETKSRRRQNKLLQGSRNTNIIPTHCKSSTQQHCLHTRAEFFSIDIKNFYINTPPKRREYLQLKIADIPQEIIDEYKLNEKATDDGYVYVAIKKDMYDLPRVGLLTQELMEQHLATRGYYQSKLTPGIWKHKWRPIHFLLVVDDSGIKYMGKEHAAHLKQTLE